MKEGQFSDEQIVQVLQQAEKGEKTVVALCRETGISETTFYRWRARFGGMQVNEAQRLRELEKENARLKKLLAEQIMETDLLKDALSKNWGALPSPMNRRFTRGGPWFGTWWSGTAAPNAGRVG